MPPAIRPEDSQARVLVEVVALIADTSPMMAIRRAQLDLVTVGPHTRSAGFPNTWLDPFQPAIHLRSTASEWPRHLATRRSPSH